MYKKTLFIGIILLFLFSVIAPMTTGSISDISEVDVELERMLDDLRFLCETPYGFNSIKFAHYKEQILNHYTSESSNTGIVVESENRELAITIEPKLSPIVSNGGPMNSLWPIKCHDLHHTSQSPFSTIDTCAEKWRFRCDWVQGGSVIADDGTIYFGDFDDYLYALNPDGTLKWKYKTGDWIWSTPAISEDGTIYVGSQDAKLYAVCPNGTLKWKVDTGASIHSSPIIGVDGTIYFGTVSPGNSIVAINSNGTIKWKYKTSDRVYSEPCIGDDGTIYFGSDDYYFYAMNPDGTLKWRFKTGDCIKGPPSIANDGIVYIGSYDDYLYAIYPNNGTMKWKCKIGYGTALNPSIANDGTIYCGSWDHFYAVNSNGTKKWSYDMGGNRHIGGTSPAISAEGTIYIGVEIGDNDGGEIIAINPDGTEKWRKMFFNHGWCDSSPSIADDGTVYIGSTKGVGEGGYLHAFGIGGLEADADGPYYGLVDEPVQFTGTSSGGYSPHSYHWDFGDTFTSGEQNPTHTYGNSGNYTVKLTITDNEGDTSEDTTYAWIQTTNTAPDKPMINGPINGVVGTTYDFTFTVTDPDNSIVYLYVDWGDNSNTGWKGPYDPEQDVTFSHKWTKEDTFTIKAKAKDPYDAEGDWETLDVTIPRDKTINNIFLQRLLERFPLLQKLLL